MVDRGFALLSRLPGAELVFVLGLTMLAVLALLVALVAELRARRRVRMAWHAYFQEGGLLRRLLARWNGPRRLTHRTDPD